MAGLVGGLALASAWAAGPWHLEHDSSSSGHMSWDGVELLLQFRMGGGPPKDQFVAAVAGLPMGAAPEPIVFRGGASRPLRLVVQFREEHTSQPARHWRRSVYLDEHERDVTLDVKDFTGPGEPAEPDALLFGVDTMNTAPGTEGWIRLRGGTLLRTR